jgi:hypothetical protein
MKNKNILFTMIYENTVGNEVFFTSYAKNKKELEDLFKKEYPRCKLIKIEKIK